MSREEAIRFLRQLQQALINNNSWKNVKQVIGESFTMAIEALEAQRWIPVSEGLPEVDEDVWVTDDAGGLATVHGDSCGRYEDTGEKFWFSSQNVTAWMPMIIPEPYKGDDAV